jgi:hypothetical protein
LWLNGFAGSGKSVLCSTAIDRLFQDRENRQTKVGIAIFYFTFNDDAKQDASAMLRSLILQLSVQLEDDHKLVSQLCSSYQNATPPDIVLIDILRQLIQAFEHTYVVLDALDESPRGKYRHDVLGVITSVRAWLEPGLHLLASSRDEVDIRDELTASSANLSTISMKNSSVDQDIATFVASELETNKRLRKWAAHCEEIKRALVSGAEGV